MQWWKVVFFISLVNITKSLNRIISVIYLLVRFRNHFFPMLFSLILCILYCRSSNFMTWGVGTGRGGAIILGLVVLKLFRNWFPWASRGACWYHLGVNISTSNIYTNSGLLPLVVITANNFGAPIGRFTPSRIYFLLCMASIVGHIL